MNKPLRPSWVTFSLVGFTLLFLVLVPVSIEIKPNTGMAQEAPTIEFTLRTTMSQTPPMAFIGVGGDIDGVINPMLHVQAGDVVKINVINGDPVLHDFTIDEFGVSTGELTQLNEEKSVTFKVDKTGAFSYYCSIPGHRQVGMEGTIEAVEASAEAGAQAEQAAAVEGVSVVRNPSDLPAPLEAREPMTVRVDLTTQEVTGQLADGTTYDYFTFDGKVPGPMIRIRVGDTVEVNLRNAESSLFPHSIDLHSVTGPGGGAVYTQTAPGAETAFTFQALNPGLYVYHCATPSVAHHITSGMYGLILVEPERGLPPVDREFYVMQGELYTTEPFGTQGRLTFDMNKMLDEDPEYFVFNGAANALTSDENALRANVGETVRIFFGVGGPNATSSFHVIGEIFDRVYGQASLTSEPLTDVQTVSVPPGGATIVEFALQVPGRYILVDHALSRLERGLAGYLLVEGEDNPAIFSGAEATDGSGH